MNFLKNFLLSTLLVFVPIQAALTAVLALVMADLAIGVVAARKRGERILSAGLRRTIAKLLVYESVLMLGFITETYLTGPLIPFSKIIAGFIGFTEIKSLIENLNEASGGELLKGLIDKLTQQKSKD